MPTWGSSYIYLFCIIPLSIDGIAGASNTGDDNFPTIRRKVQCDDDNTTFPSLKKNDNARTKTSAGSDQKKPVKMFSYSPISYAKTVGKWGVPQSGLKALLDRHSDSKEEIRKKCYISDPNVNDCIDQTHNVSSQNRIGCGEMVTRGDDFEIDSTDAADVTGSHCSDCDSGGACGCFAEPRNVNIAWKQLPLRLVGEPHTAKEKSDRKYRNGATAGDQIDHYDIENSSTVETECEDSLKQRKQNRGCIPAPQEKAFWEDILKKLQKDGKDAKLQSHFGSHSRYSETIIPGYALCLTNFEGSWCKVYFSNPTVLFLFETIEDEADHIETFGILAQYDKMAKMLEEPLLNQTRNVSALFNFLQRTIITQQRAIRHFYRAADKYIFQQETVEKLSKILIETVNCSVDKIDGTNDPEYHMRSRLIMLSKFRHMKQQPLGILVLPYNEFKLADCIQTLVEHVKRLDEQQLKKLTANLPTTAFTGNGRISSLTQIMEIFKALKLLQPKDFQGNSPNSELCERALTELEKFRHSCCLSMLNVAKWHVNAYLANRHADRQLAEVVELRSTFWNAGQDPSRPLAVPTNIKESVKVICRELKNKKIQASDLYGGSFPSNLPSLSMNIKLIDSQFTLSSHFNPSRMSIPDISTVYHELYNLIQHINASAIDRIRSRESAERLGKEVSLGEKHFTTENISDYMRTDYPCAAIDSTVYIVQLVYFAAVIKSSETADNKLRSINKIKKKFVNIPKRIERIGILELNHHKINSSLQLIDDVIKLTGDYLSVMWHHLECNPPPYLNDDDKIHVFVPCCKFLHDQLCEELKVLHIDNSPQYALLNLLRDPSFTNYFTS